MIPSPKLMLLPALLLSTALVTQPAPIQICNQNELSTPPLKKTRVDPGPRCQMRISEIKLGRSSSDECYPFIELKTNCVKRNGPPPKNPLANYKLLLLHGDPLKFSLVVDFSNLIYQEGKQFIVIGSPKTKNVDISLGTTHAQTTFSLTVDQDMLPHHGDNNYAFLLVRDIPKNEGKEFNIWYQHGGSVSPRVATSKQIKLMIKHVVDMVILGPGDEFKRNQFSYFWKSTTNNQNDMFSTIWTDLSTGNPYKSFSMCANDYDGFNANAFSSSIESPGEPNNCDSTTPASIIPVNTEIMQLQPQCQPICHSIGASQLVTIHQPFNPGYIEACRSFFPFHDRTITSTAIQEWLRFENDPMCRFYCDACKTYLSSGFRPDVKKKANIMKTGFLSSNVYSNRDAIIKHTENTLHKEAMQFYTQLKDISFDETKKEELIQKFEQKEMETFNASMNVALFLYAEMKSGLSFKTHETLMTALRLMGANVGWLQHTDDAAQGMTKIFGHTLHVDLLKKLVLNQQPFALLADSSTSSNQPLLAVYIQTLGEDERPVTYFYSLIHMSKGEKSRDMVNSLIDQIKLDSTYEEGFEEYFKSKLTSISTDGASVMTGNVKSFRVFLEEFVGRFLPHVVCLAHNLDRSYKVGIKQDRIANKDLLNRIKEKKANADDIARQWQLTYFEKFDKFIKKLYSYYQGRGYKKWLHFLQSADTLDEIPKSMKYPYDIRWSETLYESLLAVHNNHYTLVYDSDEISEDNDFDESAQETAIEIQQRLTDKTFLFALHDLLDILSTFKKASKTFQKASAIVTGKVDTVYDILESLTNYKESGGNWLKDFLANAVCSGECHNGECTLDVVDSCEEAIIRGMQIQHQYPISLPYGQLRDIIYNNLINSIRNYFKLEMLESFEVFNPPRLVFQQNLDCADQDMTTNRLVGVTAGSLENYYTVEESHKRHHIFSSYEARLDYICRFYHFNNTINCGQLVKEWKDLIGCVVSNENLIIWKDADATIFWPKALSECSAHWTFLTKKLVRFMLVTSFTSSECERGFSIMNAIKTKSRSRLDKSTVDAIMKVKINGPDVEEFPAYKMTIEVLKIYARVDDTDFHNSKI